MGRKRKGILYKGGRADLNFESWCLLGRYAEGGEQRPQHEGQ